MCHLPTSGEPDDAIPQTGSSGSLRASAGRPTGATIVVRASRQDADEEGSSMANQHFPVTGGCLCGAVRYESKEPPTEGYYCHCTMCRKHYGGLFAAAVRIPGV